MKTVYKVFLILFIVLIALNLYGLDWEIGFLHEMNTKYIFSIVAGVVGILVLFILDTWSKLPNKNRR